MDASAPQTELSIPGIEGLEPLGRGGFGTVYRGWQPALRREVAVKVLDAPVTDEASERRFEREAMAMGSLSGHPNVVPVYDAGAVGGRPYLVMPLLRGGSLQDRLAGGPLPPEEVVEVGQGLADALAAAHASGVLHRDVKPANVLRASHGAAQLADFGVARVADTTHTMGAQLIATVGYAAPELLEGDAATERSDIYSLGATLHAAARGRPPFESGPDDTPMSLAIRVISGEPPDLRASGVPLSLAGVIERAMARRPEDRFASAAELRAALDDLDLATPAPEEPTAVLPAAGATTAIQPAATPSPAPSRAATLPVAHRADGQPRRRTVAAITALLLVVAIAAMALWLAARDGSAPDTSSEAPSTTEAAASANGPTTTEAASPATTAGGSASTNTGAGLGTEAEEATRRYYDLMDAGRTDEGWASLSPEYQTRTGEGSYRRFWSTIDGVEVLQVDGDDLTAQATLRYTREDGTTSTEAVSLRFIRGDDGSLLVDDYRVG